eukprot:TRINITY_DN46_c0_g1_i11.p1 TRINITY_DN46_c0_g1~~TRINITY_DN46_c0_g1_i11.p1  ORF type:complete len:449 (+),score=110.86 TRINITY_DN46_c0_g1_i11:132-1478(+)
MAKVFALLIAGSMVTPSTGSEVLGYLEDWVNVKWWDNNIPGNCEMGCFEPKPYLTSVKPYSSLNYGFTLLSERLAPSQDGCTNSPNNTKKAAGPCPVWDGTSIWMANSSKPGAALITESTTSMTPGMVSIREASRMAKMHPDGPKRFKVTLGGWSDYARIGNVANAQKVAKLLAQVTLWTFADGIDIDMEHLTPYSTIPGDDEFEAFTTLLNSIKKEFKETVEPQWKSFATGQVSSLQSAFNALPGWQQAAMKPYYDANIKFAQEVASNDVPHLELSYTTRFNAFVPEGNPYNYLLPGSVVPNTTFATDNEGRKVYPTAGDSIDTVNVMIYDAGPLKINFTTIMQNFVTIGKVPKEKLNVGFEPGEQAAGGIWEGMDADKKTAHYVKSNGYLGCFIWSVNPSPITNPNGTVLAPELANNLNTILQPTWRFGTPPTFTKCDPSTGYLPQ